MEDTSRRIKYWNITSYQKIHILKLVKETLTMKIIIEAETEDDYEQITRLHLEAFDGDGEAKLVQKLRRTPIYISNLSLVAKYENKIIGHVLFYPIKIKNDKIESNSLALAPISVFPKFQRKGVGSKLIQKGLEEAKKFGFNSIIVVGHSEYYPRFGFEKASKYGISAPFNVPENAFFAIELEKNGLKNCNGIVEYPKEFMGV